MSTPGSPKGKYRRTKREGPPLSAARPFRRRSLPLGGTTRSVEEIP